MKTLEPLDPEIEAIRKRMIRLLVISSSIMILGLLAVFFAILYKVNEPFNSSVITENVGTLQLPEGSQIINTALDGENILFTVKSKDGKHYVLVYEGNKLQKQYLIEGISD